MLDKENELDCSATDDLEFRKGCPACEHSDPGLDRDLKAFAQLLFDIYLANHEGIDQPGPKADIDNVR
jgi:hypothetical protein